MTANEAKKLSELVYVKHNNLLTRIYEAAQKGERFLAVRDLNSSELVGLQTLGYKVKDRDGDYLISW